MFCNVGKALLAPLVLALAAPAITPTPAAASSPGASTPVITNDDGAGFRETRVVLPLTDGHGRLSLPGSTPLVILEDVPTGAHVAVRTRSAGSWSAWTELDAALDDAPDSATIGPTADIGPVWIGHDATDVEVALDAAPASRIGVLGLTPLATSGSATAAGSADPEPVEPGPEATATFIHPRADWATEDMGWACTTGPHEAEEVDALVVHHTAGTNGYAEQDVPAIIRAIWRYHVDSRGWCDIAYNFVVDAYGGVWEARQGGITKAIIGGHTRGFNTGTIGVAQLGHLDQAEPALAMTEATRRLIGWKLGQHGIDPAGETTVTNRTGGTFAGVENGGEVPVPTVIGHRDLGSTACPGQHTYDRLPALRAQSRDGVHLVALHEVFLATPPSPAQYQRWYGVVEDADLSTAALEMAESEEYSGLIVDDLYQRVLGRPADEDPDGKAFWLKVLAAGMRVEQVGVEFYGSKEYYDRAGDDAAYITLLYDNLLHRTPEELGLAYWVGRMDAGMTPAQVSGEFYASIESRRDRVGRLYESILGRAPDASGRAHWSEILIDTSDVLLAVHLALSDEFYERATR